MKFQALAIAFALFASVSALSPRHHGGDHSGVSLTSAYGADCTRCAERRSWLTFSQDDSHDDEGHTHAEGEDGHTHGEEEHSHSHAEGEVHVHTHADGVVHTMTGVCPLSSPPSNA